MKTPAHKSRYLSCIIVTIFVFFFSNGYAYEKKQVIYATSNWAPFSYLDDTGQPKGLYYDIVKEIFEKHLDMKVVFKQLPWKRSQHYVAQGQADFLITVKTEERLKYAIPSDLPVLQLFLHIYTYKNHPQLERIRKITSPEDIKDLGLTPVTNIGNSWHQKNIDNHGIKTHYVNNEENSFKVLAMKRADLTIEPIYAGSYLINKLNLSNKIEPTEARFGPLNFYFLFSKKSANLHLLGEINAIIKELDETGRLEEITSKYKKIETTTP